MKTDVSLNRSVNVAKLWMIFNRTQHPPYLNRTAKESARVCFYPAGSNTASLYKMTGKLRKDLQFVSFNQKNEIDYLVLNA